LSTIYERADGIYEALRDGVNAPVEVAVEVVVGGRPTFDVVVLGAGMAGLCAAVSALEAGARTLVLEKASQPGGSMRMSGGTIWTAPSMDVLERWVPGGSRTRQRQLVAGLGPGLAWLGSLGVQPRRRILLRRQVGAEVDVEELTDRLVRSVVALGGEIGTQTTLDRLDAGRGAFVLATGGFGGSPELRRRHIGPYADRAFLRANPYSTGDGLRLALGAGATCTSSLSAFYGHTMPAPPADPPAAMWTAVTQYATQDAVLLDLDGRRFFDESLSMQDEVAAMHIVRQRDARAFLVMDRRVHADEPLPGRSEARTQPNYANAVAAGAPHVAAPTLDSLADALGRWGVDRDASLRTLVEFNAAVAGGRSNLLEVPRRGSRIGLVEPPFHALAVRPGITFTLGGIEVDDAFHVLDDRGRPVPGLFAAGADAGGTYADGYMGGLVLGLVQGRLAGRNAARSVLGATGARA
jgi:succinate dehydrogenase/fumarate reductase flavoprotein subunit